MTSNLLLTVRQHLPSSTSMTSILLPIVARSAPPIPATASDNASSLLLTVMQHSLSSKSTALTAASTPSNLVCINASWADNSVSMISSLLLTVVQHSPSAVSIAFSIVQVSRKSVNTSSNLLQTKLSCADNFASITSSLLLTVTQHSPSSVSTALTAASTLLNLVCMSTSCTDNSV